MFLKISVRWHLPLGAVCVSFYMFQIFLFWKSAQEDGTDCKFS